MNISLSQTFGYMQKTIYPSSYLMLVDGYVIFST